MCVGCSEYNGTVVHGWPRANTQAAEDLMRVGCESTDDEDVRLSLFFCVSISCCALFLGSVQDILSGDLSIWRALRLEGCFGV